MIDSQLLWYSARAAGIVAWALLSASVIWGLAISTRLLGRKVRRPWLLDLHRYLSGLAVIFTGVHVGSIMLDSYTSFGPVQVLVPLTAPVDPLPVAAGIVGMYLLVAVEVSSLVRDRLSREVWHALHLLSFPLFVLASLHLLTAGTDEGNGALQWAVVIVTAAVAGLVAARVQRDLERRPAPPASYRNEGVL